VRHPARPRRRSVRGQVRTLLATLVLVAGLLPTGLVAVTRAAGPALPSGFTDELLATGLNHPTALAFAPNGRVYVAEQRGVVKSWSSYAALVANVVPVTAVDLQSQVDNYWDRGLLGLAVDPDWPSQPFLYVLYTFDALPGGSPPRWSDACPSSPGPGSTTDGCVVTGRLDRIPVNTATGVATGSPTHLITDWCQQFPSHSLGTLTFGADKMLYVSAGEGANFNGADWGQFGGTLPDSTSPITPANPCADPVNPAHLPPVQDPPTFDAAAQGGAMRAQNVATSRDPVSLDGSILRIDPHSATGAAAPGNPLAGSTDLNRQRIVGYGLRNPFRIAFRPGTDDLWIGDVGYNTWEELDHLPNATDPAGPTNFGWPCYENLSYGNYYNVGEPTLCANLKAAGTATTPVWAYRHGSSNHMVAGDACATGGASISGLAFYGGTDYPASYRGGLFIADYTRRCIAFMPAGGGGLPAAAAVMPFEANAPDDVAFGAGPVQLVAVPTSIDPAGDILYVNLGASTGTAGEIHRIRYASPQAAFTASPTSGAAPLDVHVDGSASTSQVAGGLSYTWDLDDGSGPSTGPAVFDHAFPAGTYHVHLTVTDGNGAISQTSRTISSDNTPPLLSIDAPAGSLTWRVGDTIHLVGSAIDAQDGDIAASITWAVNIQHCPAGGPCHSHPLMSFTGSSGDIVAPDHDAPTYLHITAAVTDSGGQDEVGTVDLYPETSLVTVGTSPAGLPVTIGSLSGPGPIAPEMVVGSTRTVSASAQAALGERTYAFAGWSDGLAVIHDYTATPGPASLTASYQLIDVDAPDACPAAKPQASLGSWFSGTTRSATDVDWFRFTLTKTQTVQVVLGELPSDAALGLYRDCSTLLATSDRGGTAREEIIRRLGAGTYSVRVAGHGGFDISRPYVARIRPLGTSPVVLSFHDTVAAGTLRIAGEVLDASTTRRGPVTLRARLYDAAGHLLATWTRAAYLPVLDPLAKSPFLFKGAAPAGYDHAVLSVAAAPTTSAVPPRPSIVTATAGLVGGLWTVSGTARNATGTTMRDVRILVTEYSPRGNVIAVAYVTPAASTLRPGRTTTFKVSFGAIVPASTRVVGRASR
jgi:glucose/arabinose dehydrogenase/PKD repeat protein